MKIKNVSVVKVENFECYSRWLSRNLTEGRDLAKYTCPHCEAALFTDVPCVGDVSDSLSNCPVCDGLFFKVINNSNGYPVVSVSLNPMIA